MKAPRKIWLVLLLAAGSCFWFNSWLETSTASFHANLALSYKMQKETQMEMQKEMAKQTPKAPEPPDPDDGSRLICDALTEAKRDHKRVLVQFGAQGCTWCHVLQKLFESDTNLAAKLKSDFVYVNIDVTRGRNKYVDELYGHVTSKGVPVIIVLDAEGKEIYSEGYRLVEGRHPGETYHISPETMLNFLKEWSLAKSPT
jgi:thiol:disulfide interchange protein